MKLSEPRDYDGIDARDWLSVGGRWAGGRAVVGRAIDCTHAIRTDSYADFHFNSKMENLHFEIKTKSAL